MRRPWRRRGLARALLAASLVARRDAGMESAGLSVFMQNPHGAVGLYEGVGFETIATTIEYRRAFG